MATVNTNKKTSKKTTTAKQPKVKLAKHVPTEAAGGETNPIVLTRVDAGVPNEFTVYLNGRKAGTAVHDEMSGVNGTGDWLDGEFSERVERMVLALVKGDRPKVRLVTGDEKPSEKAVKAGKAAKAARAKVEKAVAKKGKTEKKAKAPSSGARIRELLAEGKDSEAILVIIHKEFPDSKATKGDVAWNKWKMKQG